MIVLDTNVISELLRPVPEPSVLDWLAKQPRASLFTTTVTRGEILYGQARDQSGRLFDLTVDRCSGDVVDARPLDGPRDYAYGQRRYWPRPY